MHMVKSVLHVYIERNWMINNRPYWSCFVFASKYIASRYTLKNWLRNMEASILTMKL